MADTSTIALMLELARQDESPLRSEWSRESIADETITAQFVRAATTGVTVDLQAFDTIDALIVRNRSQTTGEDVRLEYTYNEFTQEWDIGNLRFLPSAAADIIIPIGPGFDFVNSNYRTGARLRISGADLPTNNGNFVIGQITGGGSTGINVNTNSGFSDDPSDDRGPIFDQDHLLSMPLAPGCIHIANRVYPPNNLLITSLAGEPKIDIWVLGT